MRFNCSIIVLSNMHNSYLLQLTFKKLVDVVEMERPGKPPYFLTNLTLAKMWHI